MVLTVEEVGITICVEVGTVTQENKRPVPPYLPYRTFASFLEGLRTFVPLVIDRSSMRSYSGAIQSWLLSALRYLNMIDEDGVPRPRLEQLAQATDDQRKALLRHLIEVEYGFLKGIDLSRATPRQVNEAFESAGAQGDTVRKAVAFFLALAKDAGVPLSPLLSKAQRRAPRQSSSKRTANGNGPIGVTTSPSPPLPIVEKPSGHQTPEKMLIDMLDPNVMDDVEQTAIWTLLKYLKKAR